MKKSALAFLLGAATIAAPALADDAGLLRCRAITDGAQRLACYDALAAGVRAAPPAAPAASAPSQFGLPKPAPAAPATTAKAAPASPAAEFGLPPKPTPAEELVSIQSHVNGRFEGWRENTWITLANGQTWQIADHSRVVMDKTNPKVTISRGAMGAYYMEIEGRNGSTRVRRVR